MKLGKLAFRRYRYIGLFLGLLLILVGLSKGLNAQDTNSIASSFTIQAAPTQLSWSTVAPSPIGRIESLTALGPDKKLYVFGGYIDTSYNSTKRSDVYDPASNTWTRIADMPKALTHVGVVAYGRDIYFAGGYEGKTPGAATYGGQIFAIRDVWRYSIDENKWYSMPPLPLARGSGVLEILNKQLHFFGGADISRKDKGDHWILSFDAPSQGWKASASLPNPRTHLGRVSLGGKIYAIGGQHDVDSKLVTQNSVHVWDPAKPNVWTEVKSLPRARSHISSSTFTRNGRIIVAGGEYAHGKAMREITEYNPQTNTWTELTPLPVARLSGVARNINNQLFFTTGGGGTPDTRFTQTTYKGVPVLVSSSPEESSATQAIANAI